jgi:hypothetical protein
MCASLPAGALPPRRLRSSEALPLRLVHHAAPPEESIFKILASA